MKETMVGMQRSYDDLLEENQMLMRFLDQHGLLEKYAEEGANLTEDEEYNGN